MATFYNQATLSYNGRLTNSNITEGELVEVLSVTKIAVSDSYGANSGVVYAINIVNSGATPITGVSVTDNLGGYTVGTETVYPLEYVDGTLRYFVNGAEAVAPAVTPGAPLVISGFTIPANSNVSLLYEAQATEFAPLADGASITNTATVTADGVAPITASATINAESDTQLTIAKAICPAVVTDNGEITYTFIIQNSGNTAAVATDNVVITDTFAPILNPISVTYNGTAWAEGTNYTYDSTTGDFATLPGQITVPGATYTQDAQTGIITKTPGVAVITVTGTV
jgi:uncharacterized repeat protein (TIGR01451 family)